MRTAYGKKVLAHQSKRKVDAFEKMLGIASKIENKKKKRIPPKEYERLMSQFQVLEEEFLNSLKTKNY